MKIKTSEATGPALDWLAAVCEEYGPGSYCRDIDLRRDVRGKVTCMFVPVSRDYERWHPSTNWLQGGPIIERVGVSVLPFDDRWEARCACAIQRSPARFIERRGPTSLVAAMRCYVASKLGDEVDVPEELV